MQVRFFFFGKEEMEREKERGEARKRRI